MSVNCEYVERTGSTLVIIFTFLFYRRWKEEHTGNKNKMDFAIFSAVNGRNDGITRVKYYYEYSKPKVTLHYLFHNISVPDMI